MLNMVEHLEVGNMTKCRLGIVPKRLETFTLGSKNVFGGIKAVQM